MSGGGLPSRLQIGYNVEAEQIDSYFLTFRNEREKVRYIFRDDLESVRYDSSIFITLGCHYDAFRYEVVNAVIGWFLPWRIDE
jgi:hypothetical protein